MLICQCLTDDRGSVSPLGDKPRCQLKIYRVTGRRILFPISRPLRVYRIALTVVQEDWRVTAPAGPSLPDKRGPRIRSGRWSWPVGQTAYSRPSLAIRERIRPNQALRPALHQTQATPSTSDWPTREPRSKSGAKIVR